MKKSFGGTIFGPVVSLVKVTVCKAEPTLPHPSVTVHDLLTVRVHPVPCSNAIVPVAVNPLLQLSVTVALPNAAAICAAVGLQGSAEALSSVITGFSISLVKVTV